MYIKPIAEREDKKKGTKTDEKVVPVEREDCGKGRGKRS